MWMVTRCVHQGLPGFWLPTSFRVPLWAFAATRTSVSRIAGRSLVGTCRRRCRSAALVMGSFRLRAATISHGTSLYAVVSVIQGAPNRCSGQRASWWPGPRPCRYGRRQRSPGQPCRHPASCGTRRAAQRWVLWASSWWWVSCASAASCQRRRCCIDGRLLPLGFPVLSSSRRFSGWSSGANRSARPRRRQHSPGGLCGGERGLSARHPAGIFILC